MRKWQRVRFGDVGEVIAGQHIEAAHYNRNGEGTPYLTGPDDFGPITPTISKWTLTPKVMGKSTDIFLTVKGAGCGQTNLGIEAAIGRQLMALRPNSLKLNRDFLFWFLRGQKRELGQLGQGATVPGIAKPEVANIEVPLPPLAEQKRIADILDRADAILADRRAALALLDTLPQAIFLDMFGDPVTNPKGWPTASLKEICHAIFDIDHNMPKATETGVPFISAKDLVDDGQISFDDVKLISETDFLRLSRKGYPKRGDIIYSRIGVNLGKARLVKSDTKFLASYSCCTIRPKEEIVDVVFLCTLLDSPATLKQAHRGIRAIAVPDLGLGEIKSFKILLPPLPLQQEFAQRIEKVERLRLSHRESLAKLDELFAGLQHRAFAGAL